MLIGISPVVGPELLSVLYRMGHGDEIVLADIFFPGDTYGKRLIRCDGIGISDLLKGILPLISLDTYVDTPITMMAAANDDQLEPSIEQSYQQTIRHYWPDTPAANHIERYEFYTRAKQAFAVVMTGEMAKYANIILRKGVPDPRTLKSNQNS